MRSYIFFTTVTEHTDTLTRRSKRPKTVLMLFDLVGRADNTQTHKWTHMRYTDVLLLKMTF